MSIITLTTDYGLKDHFVGALKGKILSEFQEATIIDISPSGASIFDTITLSGTNYIDTISVTFSGELVNIVSQSSTHCSIYLGNNVIPGINSVIVTNQYGTSNIFYYTISHLVLGPVITNFDPTSALRTSTVNLTGSNFKVGSGNNVYYGNIPARVSANALSTFVKTEISENSPTGYVDVKISNPFGAYTKPGFLIETTGSTPIVTSVSPVFAKYEDIIHIYGQYLTDGVVSFGDSYAGSNSATTFIDDTHLTAIIPNNLVTAGHNKFINIYTLINYFCKKY